MVGSTRSETLKVQEQEREMAEDMDLFARIAEATGETLESVYRMQEAERNGLVDVLNLKQEEQKEPTGEPTESENKRRRDCSGEDAGFPPKRVATPRRRSNKENRDDEGSGKSVPTISNQDEESSPQLAESSESMIESSQEPHSNKRSKLRRPSKSKALKASKNNGAAELEDGGAVNGHGAGEEMPSNGGPEGADLQQGVESDGSSAGTEPYEGEGEDHDVQAQAADHQESPKEYIQKGGEVVSKEVGNLMEREESVEEVEEVVVDEAYGLENGEGGALVADTNHDGQVDEVKKLRFYQLLRDTIEDEEGADVANQFARLGLASKQRSANPFNLAASLPPLEAGQPFNVTTKAAEEVTLPIDLLHRVASEVKGLGLHQSSSLHPPVWVALVKQRARLNKCSTPLLVAPVSTRLPRKAKTEAMAKQVATSAYEKQRTVATATSIFEFVDQDENDFEDGPPPFKAPKFKFPLKDKEEAELEKAKRDSLFDNLRDGQVASGSGSGGNTVHDVVGNILRKNNLNLAGISISLSSRSSTANRKSSEDDEVEILNESISSKKEPEAGTSSSTSSNFKGSCPLCSLVFECLVKLETHANTCDGQSADQDDNKSTWSKYDTTFESDADMGFKRC